jgi:hypothetical protein
LGEIGENLERGILIANSSLLIDSRVTRGPADELVRAKLAEIVRLWQSWRERDENARYESIDELRTQFRALRNQLQRAAARVQDGPLLATVSECDRVVDELLSHRFYADGGTSFRRFDSVAEQLQNIERVTASETVSSVEEAAALDEELDSDGDVDEMAE